jgi:putative tryptophan/tyrosine transport system substrate-binding protein
MNKNILYIAALLISGVCLVVYFYISNSARSGGQQTGSARVALLVPAVHPAMDEIERGFKEHITSVDKSILFDVYNANGNKTLLRGQAEEIISHTYDLIFTIGAQCSQVIHELCLKKQVLVPQVFCAVDDPIKLGLVSSLVSSGDQITGVIATSLYEQQLDHLVTIKPNTRTVLLVYDPAHGAGLEKNRQEIEQICTSKGIQLRVVEVANAQEIAQRVPGFLSGVDAVLVLTDHTVVAALDNLVTLCNRYHVVLYASDLNSGDKGAALSFGVTEYDYGALGAQLALRILVDGVKPGALPVVTVQKQYLKINTTTMKSQGLDLSADQLDRLRSQGAIIA